MTKQVKASAHTAPRGGKWYSHRCPETGRWFVCEFGVDNNAAEAFSRNDTELAYDVADRLASAMNATEVDNASLYALLGDALHALDVLHGALSSCVDRGVAAPGCYGMLKQAKGITRRLRLAREKL